jgi:hypothetical protein
MDFDPDLATMSVLTAIERTPLLQTVFDTFTYRHGFERAHLITLARERMCLTHGELGDMVGISGGRIAMLERRRKRITEGVMWAYIHADLISEEEAAAAMFGLPNVPPSRAVRRRAAAALEANGVSGQRASILLGQ